MSKALELARGVIAKYGTDADKPSVHLAKALLIEADENARHREFIAASYEVATAKDVLWFEQENKRMRAVFQDLVDSMTALKNGKAFDMKISGCEWCNAKWPKTKEDTYDITMERAKRHAFVCPNHPLRMERDALLAENARLHEEARHG